MKESWDWKEEQNCNSKVYVRYYRKIILAPRKDATGRPPLAGSLYLYIDAWVYRTCRLKRRIITRDIASFIRANQHDAYPFAHLHRTFYIPLRFVSLHHELDLSLSLSYPLAKFNRALSALNNFIGIVTVTLFRGCARNCRENFFYIQPFDRLTDDRQRVYMYIRL